MPQILLEAEAFGMDLIQINLGAKMNPLIKNG